MSKSSEQLFDEAENKIKMKITPTFSPPMWKKPDNTKYWQGVNQLKYSSMVCQHDKFWKSLSDS